MGRKLRSVLDLLNPNVTERVESAQQAQKFSHDKRAQSRTFTLGDTVYARNYSSQGPSWVKGTIVDMSGSQNFSVEVVLTGQLFTWRHHIDQLKKCFEEAESQQPTDASAVSEGEEEEDISGVTEVWLDPNLSEASEQPSSDVNRQSADSNNLPRRNPRRNRKPPDRLTY